jgi:hypothetical protein
MVEETFEPGMMVGLVARRHGPAQAPLNRRDDLNLIRRVGHNTVVCLTLANWETVSDTVEGDTRVPHKASVMSSTRRTETPARYISIKASSTELSRRR